MFSDRGDLYLIRADGTGRHALTQTVGTIDRHPSWSPDGRRIMFTQNFLSGGGLYVMTVDGGRVERVPVNLAATTTAWSPDGRTAAVGDSAPRRLGAANTNSFGDVYVIELEYWSRPADEH